MIDTMNAKKVIDDVYNDMAVAGFGSPEALQVACVAYAKAWNRYIEIVDASMVLSCDSSMLDEIDELAKLVERMKEIVFHTAMYLTGVELEGGKYASKF